MDAPCSATGVICRHADLRWNKQPRDLEKLNTNENKYWWRKACIQSRYKSGKVTAAELKNKYESQNKKCYYCGVTLKNPQVDHKTPRSKGGLNVIDNIAICCKDCNHLKGTKNEAEFLGFMIEYANRITMLTRAEV